MSNIKPHSFNLNFTEEEFVKLTNMAKDKGVSIASYIRATLFNYRIVVQPITKGKYNPIYRCKIDEKVSRETLTNDDKVEEQSSSKPVLLISDILTLLPGRNTTVKIYIEGKFVNCEIGKVITPSTTGDSEDDIIVTNIYSNDIANNKAGYQLMSRRVLREYVKNRSDAQLFEDYRVCGFQDEEISKIFNKPVPLPDVTTFLFSYPTHVIIKGKRYKVGEVIKKENNFEHDLIATNIWNDIIKEFNQMMRCRLRKYIIDRSSYDEDKDRKNAIKYGEDQEKEWARFEENS